MKIVIIIVSSLIIILIFLVVLIWGTWKLDANVIDFVTLIATTALAIIVFIATLANEKKNLSSDLVIEDLKELCAIYASNTLILSELETNTGNLDEVRGKIRFNFHKADCLIDTIKAELEVSFKEFSEEKDHDLTVITKTYVNWLTGGKFMDNGFVIDKGFLRENETQAAKTICQIRLIAHKLIKQ